MLKSERIHRQWFFDPSKSGWVRTTALISDELNRVVTEMHRRKFVFMPGYRALTAKFHQLNAEYEQLNMGFRRSTKLSSGDVEVEADMTCKIFPNNPFIWTKKKE